MITLSLISALDWLIMAAFAILAIDKEVRSACFTFLFAFLVYWVLVVPESGSIYYHLAAWLNLGIGLAIINKHFVVGCLSFSLIPANLLGYFLYYKYYESTIYDNIALTIILLQILTLTIRSLHGIFTRSNRLGIRKNAFGLFVVWVINADSMEKSKKTVEKIS